MRAELVQGSPPDGPIASAADSARSASAAAMRQISGKWPHGSRQGRQTHHIQ
jgi:hypothetical protein